MSAKRLQIALVEKVLADRERHDVVNAFGWSDYAMSLALLTQRMLLSPTS